MKSKVNNKKMKSKVNNKTPLPCFDHPDEDPLVSDSSMFWDVQCPYCNVIETGPTKAEAIRRWNAVQCISKIRELKVELFDELFDAFKTVDSNSNFLGSQYIFEDLVLWLSKARKKLKNYKYE
jgi:hypothetical protein